MKVVIDLTVYSEGHSSDATAVAEAMLRAAEQVAGEPVADWSLTFGARTSKEIERMLARRNKAKALERAGAEIASEIEREKGESRG